MSIFTKKTLDKDISKSSSKITGGLKGIFNGKKIDDEILEDLETLLLSSDIGVSITNSIISLIKKDKYLKDTSISDIKEIVKKKLLEVLKKNSKSLEIKKNNKPFVIVFVGVNGAGKTTTIGKIASKLKSQNNKVLISACDTFRAGAVNQIKIWGERSNIDVFCSEKGGVDPSSVAYASLKKAEEENYDVLLVDTAGRLQNNSGLMDELSKIERTIKKIDDCKPDETIMVLDATIGQNSKAQIDIFNKYMPISGIIMNKLDGTAKGGSLISIAEQFEKPIYAIGVGEGIEDLREFDAEDFVNSLLEI